MEHPVDFECYLYSLDHVCPPGALLPANSQCQFYLHNYNCEMLQNQIIKSILLNSLLLVCFLRSCCFYVLTALYLSKIFSIKQMFEQGLCNALQVLCVTSTAFALVVHLARCFQYEVPKVPLVQKCNFAMSPHVCQLVGRSVDLS